MIEFTCPACHASIQVEPDMAGHRINCPECHSAADVPARGHAESAAPETTPVQSAPPPPPTGNHAPPVVADKDARQWGMFCHLAALAGLIGIPFGNVVGPLVIWLIKRESMPFVDKQGKNAVNFQISMTIYSIVAAFTVFIFIGFVLLPALMIFNLVVVILAALRANEGKTYNYPLSITFIK